MSGTRTKEAQYQVLLDAAAERGYERLGLSGSESWHEDPKHLLFTLARYKFVAKMLTGRRHALEVGCGDAFGTRIVQAEVERLTAIDFDPLFVADAKARMTPRWSFEVFAHDMLRDGPVDGTFDAVYALDVLEHVAPAEERGFLDNCLAGLDAHGCAIFGMPSLESQAYASAQSKAGHVNCKSAPDFKALMEGYFHNVFLFSMNDEVVHTGFHAMAHYLLAVCAGRRADGRDTRA